jgi:hypothetical protein
VVTRRRTRLERLAVLLAALSLACALGVAVTGAVVAAREDPGPDPAPAVPEGWATVTGRPGADGTVASYAVPGGAGWRMRDADHAVSYRDAARTPYASGHAPSLWFGNHCSDRGRRQPAAWVLLADREGAAGPGTDLRGAAVRSARAWARGYGGRSRATGPSPVPVRMADGTPAVRADVRIDLGGAPGRCLGTRADLSVLAFRTGSGVQGLVVARFVGVTGTLTREQVEAILGSARVSVRDG